MSDERRDNQFAVLREAQETALNLTHWHEFLKAVQLAGYRSGEMISSQAGLMFAYSLYLVGKRDFKVTPEELRAVIARWYFMSALTARYSTSPETAMEKDLSLLSEFANGREFVAGLDRIISVTFTRDYWAITLPNELATSAARSPALFAYYAALNLHDARVLFSKMRVSELLDPALRSKKASLERHHLYPKAYLASLGVTNHRETNQIANYALVEWSDNIAISKSSPAAYFPKYAARFSENELRQMMHWHALPEGWQELDYQDFLPIRRKLMAEVIREGFERLAPASS